MPVTYSVQTDPLGDTGAFDSRMVFLDADLDGDLDVLYQNGNAVGAGIGYFRNDGVTFTNFASATGAGTPFTGVDFTGRQISTTSMFVVDIDGDGDSDILDRQNNNLVLLRNDNGAFVRTTDPVPDIGSFDSRLAFGDFDGDGDRDALYQNGSTAGTGIGYLRNDGGTFTNFTDAASAGTPFTGVSFSGLQVSSNLFVFDIDDDGDVDIIDRTNDIDTLYRDDGTGFTRVADPLADTGAFDSRMVTGDFDSDGDIDVLYQNGNTAGVGFGYQRNDGGSFTNFTTLTGTPFAGLTLTNQQLTGWFAVDIDNDGDVDIVDRDQAGGGLTLFRQDGAPPRIASSTPSDNGTGVATGANITVTFSESVTKGTGNIYIVRVSDNTVVETISVGSAQVTGSGTTWTIDPSIALAGNTQYAVHFDQETFADTDGAVFMGIFNNTALNFTTAAANTTPSAGANLGLTVAEGGSGTVTSARLDFNDAEQADTAITYTITSAATNGTLFRNGVALGLNGTFTQADINNNLITFTHNGGETTSAGFGFSVSDGQGGTVTGQTFAFTVTPVDDAAVAQPDAATVTETGTLGGDLFADNGSGVDADVDGPALSIAAVNGSAGSVGNQITLASGALLTVNANGTYSYDPNGAFTALGVSGSGAANTSATDSFTYALTTGNTVTVTLTITGQDTANDVLNGTAGVDTINAGDGDDTVRSSAGNDSLDGGAGTDIIDYSTAAGAVIVRLNRGDAFNDGDGGTDTLMNFENITGSAFADILLGNEGANVIRGGAGYDQIIALEGNDTLYGGAGASNELYGGEGDDTYVVEAIGDTIVELVDQGTDTVETALATFTLAANIESLRHTGALDFAGIGNGLNNTLFGGTGNDTLVGRAGNDTLNGGAGADTADYLNAAAGVSVNLTGGTTSDDGDSGTDTLVSIENARGSAFGDTLYGSASANVLDGAGGNDTLVGRGGNDTLRGGDGTDTADYSDATGGIVVRLSTGVAQDGEGGTDFLVSIENVVGGGFDDVIFGSDIDNVFTGGTGRDTLLGLGGADILRGGSGAANELFGGAGDDTYYVDAADTIVELASGGTDLVVTSLVTHTLAANVENLTYTGILDFYGEGNASANVITGSSGRDTLFARGGDDTLFGGGGFDTIQLSGLASEYSIITGPGGVVIQDNIDGRDGRDTAFQAEQVRFSDGSVMAIASIEPGGGGAPFPNEFEKDGLFDPQVLPGVIGDGFLIDNGLDMPLVLPGETLPDQLAVLDFEGLPELIQRPGFMAVLGDDSLIDHSGLIHDNGHDHGLF